MCVNVSSLLWNENEMDKISEHLYLYVEERERIVETWK